MCLPESFAYRFLLIAQNFFASQWLRQDVLAGRQNFFAGKRVMDVWKASVGGGYCPSGATVGHAERPVFWAFQICGDLIMTSMRYL